MGPVFEKKNYEKSAYPRRRDGLTRRRQRHPAWLDDCSDICGAVRGQLGVESVSGEGSSFWVELPRIVGKKPLLSLLIVDDDRDILNC